METNYNDDDNSAPKPPVRALPAAGAAAGIRADMQAAKEAGVAYDPRGVGISWTHKFLNLKPWHPMNYRNRVKVWEAEQRHQDDERRKEQARQEFEAEAEQMKTVSMLNAEEQEKYRMRQSVNFLYMKPPGWKDEPAQQAQQQQQDGGKPAEAEPRQQQQQQFNDRDRRQQGTQQRPGVSYMAKVVGGVNAVVRNQGFELKHSGALGMSPPRGGIDPSAENQRFVLGGDVDSEEEERAYRLATMPEEEKERLKAEAARERRRREKEELRREREERKEERRRVREAKEVLRAAGVQLPGDGGSSSSSGSESDDAEARRRRRQHERKKRRKRRRKDDGDGRDGD